MPREKERADQDLNALLSELESETDKITQKQEQKIESAPEIPAPSNSDDDISIPSPKDFGIEDESEPKPLPPPPLNIQDLPSKKERKKGFFGKMFGKKDKPEKIEPVSLPPPPVMEAAPVPSVGEVPKEESHFLPEFPKSEDMKVDEPEAEKPELPDVEEEVETPEAEEETNQHEEEPAGEEDEVEKVKLTTKNVDISDAADIVSLKERLKDKLFENKKIVEEIKKVQERLKRKEKITNKKDHKITKKQKNVREMLEEADQKLLLIEQKEKAFAEKVLNDEKEFNDKILIREKELNEREAKINSITTATEDELKALRAATDDLNAKKRDLIKKIEDLRNFRFELEEKQKDFDARREEFLALHIQVKNKESFLKDFDKKKTFLEKKEKEVMKREEMIMQKELDVTKLQDILKTRENEIKITNNALKMAMERFMREKEVVEDEEFHDYLNKKLNEISSKNIDKTKDFDTYKVEAKKAVPVAKNPLARMIDECRANIDNKDFDSAKRVYNQIRLEFLKVKVSENEKSRLHNDIRALYDDINLGMLSR